MGLGQPVGGCWPIANPPWVSYGCVVPAKASLMGFPWVYIAQEAPIGLRWDFHGSSIVLVFPQASHRFTVCPWNSHGSPWVCCAGPCVSNGMPTDYNATMRHYSCDCHGSTTTLPWDLHGFTVLVHETPSVFFGLVVLPRGFHGTHIPWVSWGFYGTPMKDP